MLLERIIIIKIMARSGNYLFVSTNQRAGNVSNIARLAVYVFSTNQNPENYIVIMHLATVYFQKKYLYKGYDRFLPVIRRLLFNFATPPKNRSSPI